jgi:hypothetical protein
VTEIDESEVPASKAWTTEYRVPSAVVTGVLALLCSSSVFSGGAVRAWIGGTGLIVLIVWVVVFQVLFRRGW